MMSLFVFKLTQMMRKIAKPVNYFLQCTWIPMFLLGTVLLLVERNNNIGNLFVGIILGFILGSILSVLVSICTVTANVGVVSAIYLRLWRCLPAIQINIIDRYVRPKGKIQIAAAEVETNLWLFGCCMFLQKLLPSCNGILLGMAYASLFLAVYSCIFICLKRLRFLLAVISLFPWTFLTQFWRFFLQLEGQTVEIVFKCIILLQYMFLMLGGQYLLLEGIHKFMKKGRLNND